MSGAVDEAIKLLHDFIAADEFEKEVARARGEFFARAIAPLPGEPIEELRLGSFTEWFLFDRRLDGIGRTPTEELLKRRQDLAPPIKEALTGLTRAVHSVFLLKAGLIGGDYIHDLFTGFKYKEVHRLPPTLSVGDLVDLRLAPVGDEWFATDALVFHPYVARKTIQKIFKDARKSGKPIEDILIELTALNTKYERAPKTVKRKIYAGG